LGLCGADERSYQIRCVQTTFEIEEWEEGEEGKTTRSFRLSLGDLSGLRSTDLVSIDFGLEIAPMGKVKIFWAIGD
jgi:hypothetical protein